MRGLSRPPRDYEMVSSVDYVKGLIQVARERFWQGEVRAVKRREADRPEGLLDQFSDQLSRSDR